MPDRSARKLRLPVISSVTISNYPLYPGATGNLELTHEFPEGVCAVVGVNGQGKTTFLNALYRALLGRLEQTKADYSAPGRGQHELREMGKVNYFASRIHRDATPATVEVTVRFGKESVRIKRSLGAKLQIIELWHNQTQLMQPDEARWQDLALELSGLSSSYDFYFCVRHFLFFLEDKIPLLWNPFGQFEILRILFLDAELSRACTELHDEILAKDSIYRNARWHLNEKIALEATMQAQLRVDTNVPEDLDANLLRSRIEAARARLEEIEREIATALHSGEKLETERFGKDVRLSQARAHLETIERDFFARAFPDSQQISNIVFGYLLGGEKCLVCANNARQGADRIRRLLRENQCPACESALPRTDRTTSRSELGSRRLNQKESLVASLSAEITSLESEMLEGRVRIEQLAAERSEEARGIRAYEARLSSLESAEQVPEELRKLRDEMTVARKHQKELLTKLRSLRKRYVERLAEANRQVERAAGRIIKTFRAYAKKFLLDEAHLTYQMHLRSVGQEGPDLEFPNFVLKMASAVQAEPSERTEWNQVSESQREFVDLAFRMALLDVAVSSHGPAMIAIETPEASLDAVYIKRAGLMLRAFAAKDRNNRVIATCNINGESMVGHLLGTFGKDAKKIPSTLLQKQMINLLDEGAKTAAIEKNRKFYEEALHKALYGT